jgi:hypothetical protein
VITFELNDGMVVCTYDPETGEITDLCDWHGNEVSFRTWETAEQIVAERMAEKAGA